MKFLSLCVLFAALCLASSNRIHDSSSDEHHSTSVQLYTYMGNRSRSLECLESYERNFGNEGELLACFINGRGVIDSPGFIFAEKQNSSIRAIEVSRNKEVYYLPERTYEAFPDVVYYDAVYNNIKAIKYSNFQGLSKLKTLYLNNNKIFRIANNTFQDLTNLKYLSLHENRITFMHGAVFAVLPATVEVKLVNNICINENFMDDTAIKRLPKTVTNHCGYCRDNFEMSNCVLRANYQNLQTTYGRKAYELGQQILGASQHAYDGFGTFFNGTVDQTSRVTLSNSELLNKYENVLKEAKDAEASAKSSAERMRRTLIEKETAAKVNLELNVKITEVNGFFNRGTEQLKGIGYQIQSLDDQIAYRQSRIECIKRKIEILSKDTC